MLITRLKLQNFMSHKSSEFYFTSGHNIILGDNGSGKSSILYAIGIVLFDANRSTLKNMIKHGEKQAVIELDFIDNQSVAYSLKRSFGSTSSFELYRQSKNELVTKSYADTYDFLQHIIASNFSRLFLETLYVKSSTLTFPWRISNDARTRLFDEMFDLQAFQESWKKLKVPLNKLTEQERVLALSKENKNNLINDLELLTQKITNLENRICELEQDAENITKTFFKDKRAYNLNQELVRLNNLTKVLESLAHKNKKQQEEIDQINKYVCPTCGQDLVEPIDSLQEKAATRKTQLELDYKNCMIQIQEIQDVIDQSSLPLEFIKAATTPPENKRQELDVYLSNMSGKLETLIELRNEITSKIKNLTFDEKVYNRLQEKLNLLNYVRDNIRAVGPVLATSITKSISQEATHILSNLFGDAIEVNWKADYSISVIINHNNLDFNQLSEGQQIIIALVIKMVLAKYVSGLGIIFLDEPTINLDVQKRGLLPELINSFGFNQTFIISHDSTFEELGNNIISLENINGITTTR